MSQSFSQIISKINACIETLGTLEKVNDTHLMILQTFIPSHEMFQSIAEYYATREDIQFSDIHLQFLMQLPIEWNDTLLLNILCGRCQFVSSKLQRTFVLRFLNASQQEWALDLLEAWKNALLKIALHRQKEKQVGHLSVHSQHTQQYQNQLHSQQSNQQSNQQPNRYKDYHGEALKISENQHLNDAENSTTYTFEEKILVMDIFKFVLLVHQLDIPNNQIPFEWRKSIIDIIMEYWDIWKKEESDFIFMNILKACLEKNHRKQEILVWLWKMCRSKCGVVLQPEQGDEIKVETTYSTIDAYTPHLLDARNISYQILCQFFEYFFDDSSEIDLRMNENFWIILIEGLKMSHSYIMKRSEYLLRRIIDISQRDSKHQQYTKYFSIDNKNKKIDQLWSTWFMLWESIQSSSTHLLQPVWDQVFQFFPIKSECQPGNVVSTLHPVWTEILFHHVFNHDNFGAQKLAMASFFEFDFTKHVAPFNINYVIDVIFNYGNVARLYIEKYRIGERMIRFLQCYASQISEGYIYDPLSNPNETVSNLILKFIDRIAVDPVKVTYCGLSYIFKSLLLISDSLLSKSENTTSNILTTKVVKQLEYIATQSIFLNGSWIKVRQCAQICQLLTRLGAFTIENCDSISHLLNQFNRRLFIPALDKELLQHFDDEVLLIHIQQLLEIYFEESEIMLETHEDTKSILLKANRISRISRFVSDKTILLGVLSNKLDSTLDGIYSRSYISTITKFKTLALCSSLLYEFDDTVLRSQINFHTLLVHTLILPHLEEIISFASSHLAYPEFNSKTDSSSLQNLFKKGSQMILCDEPLLYILESSFIHVEAVRNNHMITFMKVKILEPTILFSQNLRKLYGSSFVRNPDPTVGTIANLYILRALRCYSLIVKSSEFLFNSSFFTNKNSNIFIDAFLACYNLPYIAITKSPDSNENYFKIYNPSKMSTKLSKGKWSSLFNWLSFFKRHPESQLDDDILSEVLESAVDTLDIIQVNYASIPISCIILILNLFKETKISSQELKQIVSNSEHVIRGGGGQRTDLESYYAYAKLLLGHKRSLDDDFVKEVLNPFLNALIENSVTLPRVISAIAIQIGAVLLNDSIPAEKKSALTPFIFKVLAFEYEDLSQIGHDPIEKVHFDLGSTDVDRELCFYYPPSMNFEMIAQSYLYLAIQNLPQGSEPFIENLLVNYFKSNGKVNKSKLAPNNTLFNTLVRKGKFALLASQYLNEDICKRNFETFWNSVNWEYNYSAKRLVDFFIIILLSKFDGFGDKLEKDLENYNSNSSITISLLILLGSYLVYGPNNRFIQRAPKVWDLLIAYSNSTHHNIRTIAQSILCSMVRRRNKLIEDKIITPEKIPITDALKVIQNFIEGSEASMKWISKYHPIFLFDPFYSSEPEIIFYNPISAHDKTEILDHIRKSVVNSVKDNAFGLSASICNLIEQDVSRIDFYLENWNIKRTLSSFVQDIKPIDPNYRKFVDDFVSNYVEDNNENESDLKSNTALISEDMNFQRKIVPWQEMDINNELNPRNTRGIERHPIIVCATFVDKIPNLAGLTRTSEIFHVEKLVISNKGVLRQDMFKSISVTAEQWMPIEEVPESELMNYLKTQKENGYSIIGLEQTADSVPIDQFEFPKKCVVLLGKEKEGIPTEYLQLLDTCVEIQQFGLIRSLNVHVSASVMIYEYTKQHFMSKK